MRVVLTLIFSTLIYSPSQAQGQAVDSIRTQLFYLISSSDSDSLKAVNYLELGLHYRYNSADSLLKFSELAYAISKNNNLNFLAAKSSFFMSGANFLLGNYDQALAHSQVGHTFLTNATDTLSLRLKADLFQAEGNAFGSLGNYDLSLEKFFKALDIAEMMGFKLHSRVTRSNIGVIYQRLEWFDRALEIFLQLENELDKTSPVYVIIPVNLGLTYYELGEYESAKEQLHNVLAFTGAIDKRAFGIAHFKLGQIYTAENNLDEAILSFEASIATFKTLNNELETVQSLNGLSKVFIELGDYQKALQFARKGHEIATRYHALPQTTETLQNMFTIAKALGKFDEALSYHEEFKVLSDSMQSAQVTLTSAKMETEYNYKKREQELLMGQQQAQLISETTIREQRALLAGIAIALLFSMVSIFTLYRNYRHKQQSNYLLSLKNAEIQEQAEQLKRSNNIKNRIFSLIAHDLRGPLSSLHSLISLIEMDKITKQELEELIPSVSRRFKYTSTMLNNLLQWSQSQMEGYNVSKEVFDILTVCKEKRELLQVKIEEKSLNFHLPNGEFLAYGDVNMIDLVIQNIFANAIKFCNPGDSITVSITQHETTHQICVQDTGIGIESSKVVHLFGDTFYTTRGTMDEKGTGLGLMLCKEFVERNGGKIWVQSKLGEGTKVCFTLDIAACLD